MINLNMVCFIKTENYLKETSKFFNLTDYFLSYSKA